MWEVDDNRSAGARMVEIWNVTNKVGQPFQYETVETECEPGETVMIGDFYFNYPPSIPTFVFSMDDDGAGHTFFVQLYRVQADGDAVPLLKDPASNTDYQLASEDDEVEIRAPVAGRYRCELTETSGNPGTSIVSVETLRGPN